MDNILTIEQDIEERATGICVFKIKCSLNISREVDLNSIFGLE